MEHKAKLRLEVAEFVTTVGKHSRVEVLATSCLNTPPCNQQNKTHLSPSAPENSSTIWETEHNVGSTKYTNTNQNPDSVLFFVSGWVLGFSLSWISLGPHRMRGLFPPRHTTCRWLVSLPAGVLVVLGI
ncbi:hypothetical protein AMECASPLE_020119 [Ameca splendens]|uniref:Uncharacterized protein n=1 Tax=Ameca splendens TaxID=208324 RepID=A0ABV0YEA2_9TELE